MDSTLLPTSYDGVAVLLSVFIAVFASYLALDLARRVRRQDRIGRTIWTAGGALVLGTGIWSMHFIGMLGFSLPVALGYDAAVTAWSWLAAVGVSTLALLIAARDSLGRTMLAGGSLVMGAGISAMHYIGMGALQIAPGIVWNGWLVAASVLIAVGASAVALLIFFGIRRLSGAWARLAQGGAAVVMGVAISGMHYTGMAAAGFPQGSVCLSADGLSGSSLGTIVVFATLVLLLVTLATSALDARQQARAAGLTRSLTDSNRQLRQANTELQRLAFSDALTGVANRSLFDDPCTRRWRAPTASQDTAWPCCSSTWTASSRSTTAMGTARGTPCCARLQAGCKASRARPTPWPGSAETSSCSCWQALRRRPTPRPSRHASWRPPHSRWWGRRAG